MSQKLSKATDLENSYRIGNGQVLVVRGEDNSILIANRSSDPATNSPAKIDQAHVHELIAALQQLSHPDPPVHDEDPEYYLQISVSQCPQCGGRVTLIYPEPYPPNFPIFYLCFPCQLVGRMYGGALSWTNPD